MSIDNGIAYKKENIARIIINNTNGTYGVGTAFPIGDSRKYLSCFHVVFGKPINEIRNDSNFAALDGNNEDEKLLAYQKANTKGIQLQLPNGMLINALLEKFNAQYDAATVTVTGKGRKQSLELDTSSVINIGDQLFFCGYQSAVRIEPKNFPFTINSGFVSTMINTEIGGGNYEHLQINSINLGGNSGAPVFRANENQVIAMINGNMNWGRDDFAIFNEEGRIIRGSSRTPLSIAYATPLALIKLETDLLD